MWWMLILATGVASSVYSTEALCYANKQNEQDRCIAVEIRPAEQK